MEREFLKWKYVHTVTNEVVEAFLYDGDFMDVFGHCYVPKWAQQALNKELQYDGLELYWVWTTTNPMNNIKTITHKAIIIPNETYIIAKEGNIIATIQKNSFAKEYKKLEVVINDSDYNDIFKDLHFYIKDSYKSDIPEDYYTLTLVEWKEKMGDARTVKVKSVLDVPLFIPEEDLIERYLVPYSEFFALKEMMRGN